MFTSDAPDILLFWMMEGVSFVLMVDRLARRSMCLDLALLAGNMAGNKYIYIFICMCICLCVLIWPPAMNWFPLAWFGLVWFYFANVNLGWLSCCIFWLCFALLLFWLAWLFFSFYCVSWFDFYWLALDFIVFASDFIRILSRLLSFAF